jgi:heat shock protein HtpX
MSLTFVEIEKQKNWRIAVFFLILLSLYFVILTTLSLSLFIIAPPLLFLIKGFLFRYLLIVIAVSLLVASMHFYFSAFGAISFLKKNLCASKPDLEDGIHKRLKNIIDEVHVATGNKRKIDCMVIPSLAMNALAVDNFRGNAVIAVTEGLISRLTRPQLEAVVAHEAYHILSGDCLEATVAASLFGIPASIIEGSQNLSEHGMIHPLLIPTWILLKFSQMFNMFISREREYRADAGAVKMNRNPVALAEALHKTSRGWRGAGFLGSGLEMLCIINPKASELDESEGWLSDLFSTHPPIRKRVGVLLRMARASLLQFYSRADAEKKAAISEPAKTPEPLYYAFNEEQEWQGPFNLAGLSALPWLTPLTWVGTAPDEEIERASENPIMNAIFIKRLINTKLKTADLTCPNCKQALIEIPYERTQIYQCNFCKGTLVENNKIPRIIVRDEEPCPERIKQLSSAVINEKQKRMAMKRLNSKEQPKTSIPFKNCPKCKKPMMRRFYSLVYLIEVDMCSFCGITWFDKDELEMLQCMVENRIVPEIELSNEE